MKYTNELQHKALELACKNCSLSSHIAWTEYKKDLSTWSDRIMGRWFRKGIPHKKSYMYCDTLDMNFFYDEEGRPTMTYAGYSKTIKECESVINAFELSKKMLREMKEVIEDLAEGSSNE